MNDAPSLRDADAPRVGFVSLGCAKATVDSEHILTRLRAEGYRIVPSYQDAQLVIVNTCGFIDAAVEESLEAIGEALEENGRVVVTGCLGAKGDVVQRTHPAVLDITGPHAAGAVMDAVHRHLPAPHHPFTSLVPPQGVRLTPGHYAYLKISEGCNHHCSFCIIPSMRGRLVSRSAGDVMAEAEGLVRAGVGELLVISQDTSAYGVDLRYRSDIWAGRPLKTRITELAAALGQLGVWVRLHYVYPYPHVDELVELMAAGTVLPYLDVPLQHGSPRILKAMRRPADAEDMARRIAAWRDACPRIALRSTFIVGFPGETEAEFRELLEFLAAARLDRVGAFTYSPVEGATANALGDPVPEEVKEERLARLMEAQAAISRQRLAARHGEVTEVVVDEVSPEAALCRSELEAPDVDGVIVVESPGDMAVGRRYRVRIVDSDEHDLWAEKARE